MASHIFLVGSYPQQEKIPDYSCYEPWHETLTLFRGRGKQVIIAKGNRIAEVEAKT